jgi:hypothetical protein
MALSVGVVLLIAVVLWLNLTRRHTTVLRGQFGPEYDRAADR